MSFLSILQNINSGLKVGIAAVQPIAPVVGLIPGIGGIFGTVLGTVTAVEHLIPDAPGSEKKSIATTIVTTAHPEVSPAALSASIDQLVAALNALQKAPPK